MKTGIAFAVMAVVGMGAAALNAAVLIEVDVSDPAAVTFTATGNASQIVDSSATVNDGVDLVQFFSSPLGTDYFGMSGNLTPPSAHGQVYNLWMADIYAVSRTSLNLYRSGANDSDLQVFSTSAPAFTGMGVADLSIFAALLPTPGASGDIAAGYSGHGSHAVIGQWAVVVPEPSMLLLGGIGAAAFLLRRRNAVG